MTFRAVSLLWLLTLVPFATAMFLARERTRTRLARRFASERLRGVTNPARPLRPWLLGIAVAAAVLALAGPYAGFTTVPVIAREANRILVIDVSNSMAAQDVGTTRLTAAKALAKRIADAQNGRVALIVFEAQPNVTSPLTSDTDAVVALIDSIQPGEIGEAGSDIGGAILGALKLIEADPTQKADVVLISDGEDQGVRIRDAVQRAKAMNVPVSTIVLGSPEGSAISTADGPLRDDSGQIVTTYARPEVLADLAKATGGGAYVNPFAERAIAPLLADSRTAVDRRTEVRVPVDRYQWPLALAFFALLGGSLLNRGAE
jgi:Ca-activated chloride channel homolog